MQNKVKCEVCGKVIPVERLEILPETTRCVACSQITPYSADEALGPNPTDADIGSFDDNIYDSDDDSD